MALPSAASRRCAISFLIRNRVQSGPMPKLAQATVRAAVSQASHLVPKLALIAGGKSFGGRMTSQAQAALPLSRVRALVFLGFPLHPAGRPSDERADHLFEVKIPMLFLQGTRDALAETQTPGRPMVDHPEYPKPSVGWINFLLPPTL